MRGTLIKSSASQPTKQIGVQLPTGSVADGCTKRLPQFVRNVHDKSRAAGCQTILDFAAILSFPKIAALMAICDAALTKSNIRFRIGLGPVHLTAKLTVFPQTTHTASTAMQTERRSMHVLQSLPVPETHTP
jgi:hypothetical protein